MVVSDTNIIIDQLRRPKGSESHLVQLIQKESEKNVALSLLSVQELFEGKSSKEKRKQELLLATLSPLTILPYTYDVARLAGEIARDSKQPIEFTDAAIAATALLNKSSLLTLNKKDFDGIPGLQLYT